MPSQVDRALSIRLSMKCGVLHERWAGRSDLWSRIFRKSVAAGRRHYVVKFAFVCRNPLRPELIQSWISTCEDASRAVVRSRNCGRLMGTDEE